LWSNKNLLHAEKNRVRRWSPFSASGALGSEAKNPAEKLFFACLEGKVSGKKRIR